MTVDAVRSHLSVFCIQNVSEWSVTSIEVTQFCTLLLLCDGQTFQQNFHHTDRVFIHCMVDDQQEAELRSIAYVLYSKPVNVALSLGCAS